jgi:hypothetical protein
MSRIKNDPEREWIKGRVSETDKPKKKKKKRNLIKLKVLLRKIKKRSKK